MKTAIVTGAASGIGRRTVERLIDAGWSVWALDLSIESLEKQASTLGAGGRLKVHNCDVSSPESTSVAFAAVAKAVRNVDALICSAGVLRIGSMEESESADVDLMFDVNVKGPWLCVCAALPMLRMDASTTMPSRVVIVGSISGIRPKAGAGFYGASKAAVHVIAGVMAVELAPSGILVNVVAPGTVDTPMIEAARKVHTASGYQPSGESPLGRIAQPDDVVDVIEFFLGDAAKYVTGTVLPVDGGTRAAFVKK